MGYTTSVRNLKMMSSQGAALNFTFFNPFYKPIKSQLWGLKCVYNPLNPHVSYDFNKLTMLYIHVHISISMTNKSGLTFFLSIKYLSVCLYYIPENRPNFSTTKGFRIKISMKLVYQYIAIFFNF